LPNLHPIGGQLDANFIRLVASRMLLLIILGIFYWIAASRDAICIRLAADWMKFASGWRLTKWNLHPADWNLHPAEWNLHLAGRQLDADFAKIRS
jgi:hypothetical protein